MKLQGDQWMAPGFDRPDDRLPAFVPGWKPGATGPARAILEIAARYASLLGERLSKAVDKAKLAFLEALGVDVIPAQPARCPVVFELMPGANHSKAPAHTRLGAQSTDAGQTLEFETVSEIGLAAATLADVRTVLPGNRFVDHSQDVLGENPFQLFANPQPIRRELYLAHDRLLALLPDALLEIMIDLAPNAAGMDVGPIDWQYWDGAEWVPFEGTDEIPDNSAVEMPAVVERTKNLPRSGTIRFRIGERPNVPTTVRSLKSFWMRAVVSEPAIESGVASERFGPQMVPPQIDRIRIAVVSKVSGFRLFHRTEMPAGAKGANVRIRLVDENGVPLRSDQYIVTRLSGPASGPKTLPGPDKLDYFDLPADTQRPIRVRISWPASAPKNEARIDLDLPRPDRSYDFDLARAGRSPELAFGNGLKIDPSASFFPLGQQPQPGATFLFSCPEVTSKPGAKVTIFTEVSSGSNVPATDPTPLPRVRWEYWNGSVWAALPDLKGDDQVLTFRQPGDIRFTMPANITIKSELGQEKQWLRAHLFDGGYVYEKAGTVGSKTQTIQFDKTIPPVVQKLRIAYEYASPPEPPQSCQLWSDFRWQNVTAQVNLGGNPFKLFQASVESRPALYLGFSRSLPTDLISLFFNVVSLQADLELAWEYWDGTAWRPLTLAKDETHGLSRPGLIQFIWPGLDLPEPEKASRAQDNTVSFLDKRSAARFHEDRDIALVEDDAELATIERVVETDLLLTSPLAKKFNSPSVVLMPTVPPFGTPRNWIRVVWPGAAAPIPGTPGQIDVQGIYLNAVWAEQASTHDRELVGATVGTASEAFALAHFPVLKEETVEILELEGALADAGWAVLAKQLKSADRPASYLRTERELQTGKVTQVWVRWEARTSFAASKPGDRHYVLERARGRLQFGDGVHGMTPPVNPNNVFVSYRSGGGLAGNVAARRVTTVLAAVPGAQRVFNPIAAAGGADGELAVTPAGSSDADSAAGILDRGPQVVRHRHRALSALDYEQLALEASPGVAVARAVTPAATHGVLHAGSVRIAVVPTSDEKNPQPLPSREICEEVRQYVEARAPAVITGRIEVVGPEYFPVGVETILVPVKLQDAGALSQAGRDAILRFLHPVVGGLKKRGWHFGESVRRSDLVTYLHQQLGGHLSYVEQLQFLDQGAPASEDVTIPPDRLPVAGPVRILLRTDAGVVP